ncbi:cytochrome P450 [Suillus spraguei]|nr:cytochrome P450 [Suillus spraguei]
MLHLNNLDALSISVSLTIAQWIEEYGPLIIIRSGIQTVVIIGRYNAAMDIMEIHRFGARWGQVPSDAALHTHLQPKSAEVYEPLQMSQAKNVCQLNDFSAKAPTFADRSSLPLLTAFISEVLRWRPLAEGGLPHRTTEDENYCIPAGTTVVGNLWAISRDPEAYPELDAFKLQRWVDDQGCLRDDLAFFVYGFGRRSTHIADRSVFINPLLILWAFKLSLDPTNHSVTWDPQK